MDWHLTVIKVYGELTKNIPGIAGLNDLSSRWLLGAPNCQFVQLQNSQIIQAGLRSQSSSETSGDLIWHLVTYKLRRKAQCLLEQTLRQVSAAGCLGHRSKGSQGEDLSRDLCDLGLNARGSHGRAPQGR